MGSSNHVDQAHKNLESEPNDRFSDLSDDDEVPLNKSILKKPTVKSTRDCNEQRTDEKKSSGTDNSTNEASNTPMKRTVSKKYVPLSDVSDASSDDETSIVKKAASKKANKETTPPDTKSPKSSPYPQEKSASPLRRTSVDRSSRSISPRRTMTNSTSSLNRCFSSAEALSRVGLTHQSQRSSPYETFGTSISVKRTEHKVDEIKSIIEQQEAKMSKYGRLIEAADTRIRDHFESNEETERSILHRLTLEKEALIDDLKAERKTFNTIIVDAVRELRNAQQFQQRQQTDFLQAQKEIALLTEQHNAAVAQTMAQQQKQQCQEVQLVKPCSDCSSYKEELGTLMKEMENISKEAGNLKKQVQAETETNNSLSKHISEIQSLAQTQSDTIQCLTAVSTDLEVQLRESIRKSELLAVERDKFQNQYKKLANELESARDEVSHLESVLEKKKAWVFQNKGHIDDYKSALAAAGLLDILKSDGKSRNKGLSHICLEDFIMSTMKEVYDLRRQLHQKQSIESEQAQQIQNYKQNIEKKNGIIAMNQVQLESSFLLAEGLRSERDYAISKIKDAVKLCKSRDNQFQIELQIREKGVRDVVETSNLNLKTVREGYEVERQKFKEEIKDLLRENMTMEANLRAISKDKREMEAELKTTKKKLEFRNTEYLRELGLSI
ncbi:hypothetical protein BDR26DRAFT_608223 [Obelidium mucronatum]|nr:hypothetical protein BDR26DRAFT_608223 [Obelidium mucronatum]